MFGQNIPDPWRLLPPNLAYLQTIVREYTEDKNGISVYLTELWPSLYLFSQWLATTFLVLGYIFIKSCILTTSVWGVGEYMNDNSICLFNNYGPCYVSIFSVWLVSSRPLETFSCTFTTYSIRVWIVYEWLFFLSISMALDFFLFSSVQTIYKREKSTMHKWVKQRGSTRYRTILLIF